MTCPRCGAPLYGPCGDSAWEPRWIYLCNNDECSVEVSIEQDQATPLPTPSPAVTPDAEAPLEFGVADATARGQRDG